MAFNSFANRIPPGVPGQKDSMTPQNNEGLAVPWGQAMFSLPRSQMPGTTVGFNGGFGLDMTGDMQTAPGQSQTGMAPQPVGGVRFSLTRQASSDPVQNIINDIQNPLGGANLQFGGGGAPPAAPGDLKKKMVAQPADAGDVPNWGRSQNPYAMAMENQKRFGVAGSQPTGMDPLMNFAPIEQQSTFRPPPGYSGPYGSPATGFGLRSRMTGFY